MSSNGFDPARPRETDGTFAEYKSTPASGTLSVPSDDGPYQMSLHDLAQINALVSSAAIYGNDWSPDPDSEDDAERLNDATHVVARTVEMVAANLAAGEPIGVPRNWEEKPGAVEGMVKGADAHPMTLADLDGSDDAADWLTEGHVLDRSEVEFLRRLRIS